MHTRTYSDWLWCVYAFTIKSVYITMCANGHCLLKYVYKIFFRL